MEVHVFHLPHSVVGFIADSFVIGSTVGRFLFVDSAVVVSSVAVE